MTLFGGVPYPLAIFAAFVMSLFSWVSLPLFCWLARVIQRQVNIPAMILYPAVYITTEWFTPKLFPWYIGAWIHPWREARQIADITGILGPTLLVISVNVLFFLWWQHWRERRRLPLVETIFVLLFLTASHVYGTLRISDLGEKLQSARKLKVSVAQSNIGSLQKEQAQRGGQEAVAFAHRRNEELVIEAGKESPDLIVLPETAVHGVFTQSKILQYRMFSLARDVNAGIFFGGYHSEFRNGQVIDFNSAFLITPESQLYEQYNKIKLLLFGEYLPLPNAPFWPQSVKDAVGQFERGKEIKVIPFKGEKIGPLICYEGILPQLVNKFVKNGVTFFVNVSNDSWFGDTSAPHQHFLLETWRSVEHRKPLVRSTNTGISGFVNIFGDMSGIIPINQAGVKTEVVQIIDEETLYDKLGDWLLYLATIITLLSFVGAFFKIATRIQRLR